MTPDDALIADNIVKTSAAASTGRNKSRRADSSSDHDSEKRDKLFELPDISQLQTRGKRDGKQEFKKSPEPKPKRLPKLPMMPTKSQQVSTMAVINLHKTETPKRQASEEINAIPLMFLDGSNERSIDASKVSSVSGNAEVSLNSWDMKYSKDEQDYLNKIAGEANKLNGLAAIAHIIKRVIIAK